MSKNLLSCRISTKISRPSRCSKYERLIGLQTNSIKKKKKKRKADVIMNDVKVCELQTSVLVIVCHALFMWKKLNVGDQIPRVSGCTNLEWGGFKSPGVDPLKSLRSTVAFQVKNSLRPIESEHFGKGGRERGKERMFGCGTLQTVQWVTLQEWGIGRWLSGEEW